MKLSSQPLDHVIPDLATFDCGDIGLNQYLQRAAILDSQSNLNNTTLFFNEQNDLVGFYAVATGIYQIKAAFDAKKFESIPGVADKDIIHDEPAKIPIITINDFAVDKKFQNYGAGHRMMLHLFKNISYMANTLNIGFVGVFLEALPDAVEFYQSFKFKYLKMDYDSKPVFRKKYPMCITIDEIAEILDSITETSK